MAHDLNTNVTGIQTVITLFTLTMAALMIPGSKLSDIWGRKTCLLLGLYLYGFGALLSALAPTLGVLIFGNALLEGVGSALMIPPVYILVTVGFTSLSARAKAFGVISASAGIGSSIGPLLGGLITTTISWRASFLLQTLVIVVILVLSQPIVDAEKQRDNVHFDTIGAILSAVGLLFMVIGVLLTGNYGWVIARGDFSIGDFVVFHQGGISPVWAFIGIGALFLLGFFLYTRSVERAGKTPLLSLRLFRNRTANLGLVTQNIQWLTLQGSSFVLSVYLLDVRGFSAIQAGLALTPATIGMLFSSLIAGRLAKKYSQTLLIQVGFTTTIVGMVLLLLLGKITGSVFAIFPGLLLMGMGIGVMLTSSVNVVQSSFPERDQGEISGLSRSISNLGSSLGTAIVGSVLVSSLLAGNKTYAVAFIVMIAITIIGLVVALFLPADQQTSSNEFVNEPQHV